MAQTPPLGTPLRRFGELLGRYLRPQWRRVGALAFLLGASIALQLINPQIVRFFLDAATGGGSTGALTGAALLFFAGAVLQQGLTVGATYVGETVAWRATNRLRADLAGHCLSLDLGFHKRHTPGEMIERVDGDVNALADFFSQFVIRIVGNAVLLVGVLALLYREDVRLGLAFSALAAVAFGALNRVRSLGVPHWTRARQANAELAGFIEERLGGTEDIRSGGFVPHVMAGFYALARERLFRQRRAGLMGSVVGATGLAVFTVAYGLAIVLGAWLYGSGVLSVGAVYLIFSYTDLLQRPINQITAQLENLQKAAAGMVRIDELLQARSALVEVAPGAARALPAGPLGVELAGVRFAYEPDEPVLRDVSFRLAPGRVLGVVGRTGSGKTTLTRLLLRLYDCQEGAVRLGGVDVRDVPLAALRRRVGAVTQDVQLFHASLRDNLTLFDPGIPDGAVLAAIDGLGLGGWLRSRPEGLDTLLESGGGGLSAGEAQLLAFTRVFLRDPGLVLLDEPTSRLDPATGRLVEGAVGRLLEGRSGVIVAHRLETTLRADDVLILEDGRVAEWGPRARLMADPDSRFAGLLRTGLEPAPA